MRSRAGGHPTLPVPITLHAHGCSARPTQVPILTTRQSDADRAPVSLSLSSPKKPLGFSGPTPRDGGVLPGCWRGSALQGRAAKRTGQGEQLGILRPAKEWRVQGIGRAVTRVAAVGDQRSFSESLWEVDDGNERR